MAQGGGYTPVVIRGYRGYGSREAMPAVPDRSPEQEPRQKDFADWLEPFAAGYIAHREGVPEDESMLRVAREGYERSGSERARKLVERLTAPSPKQASDTDAVAGGDKDRTLHAELPSDRADWEDARQRMLAIGYDEGYAIGKSEALREVEEALRERAARLAKQSDPAHIAVENAITYATERFRAGGGGGG